MYTELGLNQQQKKRLLEMGFSLLLICITSKTTTAFLHEATQYPSPASTYDPALNKRAHYVHFKRQKPFRRYSRSKILCSSRTKHERTHRRVTSWEVDYCCLPFNRSWISGCIDGFGHWHEWPLQFITACSLASPTQLLGSALGQVASNQDTVKHEVMIITEN